LGAFHPGIFTTSMPRPLIPHTLLLLSLAWAGLAHAQRPLSPPTWTFGISLATGQHSELYTLFLVKEHGGKVIGVEPITREQFVLQAQGAIPSKANPEGINLFLVFGVQGCLHPDDNTKLLRDCPLLDQVWKLRFFEYPFRPTTGGPPRQGWAEMQAGPSPRQMLLLSNYGIQRISDLAWGEEAFNLLRDLGDPDWVDNYRKGL
jgi:hypothetical protein